VQVGVNDLVLSNVVLRINIKPSSGILVIATICGQNIVY